MKFVVDVDQGTIQQPSVRVPFSGSALHCVPVSPFVLQDLAGDLANVQRLSYKSFAADLGKEVRDLTPEERITATSIAKVPDEVLTRIKEVFTKSLVGWDDDVVGDADGNPIAPDTEMPDGRLLKETFAESLVGSSPTVVMRILGDAVNLGGDLEGNSSMPSAGASSESTAIGNSSPEKPAAPETDVSSLEVEVAPV